MNRLVAAIDRAEYMRHLAHIALLRTVYILPCRDMGIRAHNRLAIRQALARARFWRTTTLLPRQSL
jgi:hypothetical protein